MASQEKLRVRIRRGSVDIEASGESQEDLEQALKALQFTRPLPLSFHWKGDCNG